MNRLNIATERRLAAGFIRSQILPFVGNPKPAARRRSVAHFLARTFIALAVAIPLALSAAGFLADENFLEMPEVGSHRLRIISPNLLELTLVTTKLPDPAPVTQWDFVEKDSKLNLPSVDQFVVTAGNKTIPIEEIGFKRRPIYAPLKKRDLRIGNQLYLHLKNSITNGQIVQVKDRSAKLWPTQNQFIAKADPLRWSPAIHVNQEGYIPGFVKKAMVGYFLGSMGELEINPQLEFNLIESHSNRAVFSGKLLPRHDIGYTYNVAPYQQVSEADFSEFKKPGEYRLQVPGLGASFPFRINEGIAANFARTYALGLYHQRCGAANELPFTRFTHRACHTQPAEIPDKTFKAVNQVLQSETGNFSGNRRHTAPQLKNVDASLYPFVNRNKIDVTGGHHDAGDYSKYTINSAQLIHTLVFAADCFEGVGALDNLGLPESGDGKSDLLQIAKWEAVFLAKMQDADGGFYFLVYPRDRRYEHDVLPDRGDPQIVYPKTTSATAAAVAALAQTASSPLFKKQFPEEAATYLAKAIKGWAFLEQAIAKNGRDGSYQKITHYGDEFMHDDELAWAATELFLATGDKKFEKELIQHFRPDDRETKRWTWWRLFESYGCAIRSYAFAKKTKRLRKNQLGSHFFQLCEAEILAAAEDQLRYANENAYGASFPSESKRFRNAGWFFSTDRAFELATACQIDFPMLNDPRPKYVEAIIGNMNYEAGCNPVNVSYITGIGWNRPREMVHHYAQNDWRTLPPSGLPFGNIQEGFPYLEPYKKELGALTFPYDGDQQNPTPFYDRWGDTFNTAAEFVTPNLGRSLATTAFLMAKTETANQKWKSASAKIVGVPPAVSANEAITALAQIGEMNLSDARVLWELQGKEPALLSGNEAFKFSAANRGSYFLEAEIQFPDGRRIFAITRFVVAAK